MRILLLNKSHFAKELRELGHEVLVVLPIEELDANRLDAWSLDEKQLTYKTGDSLNVILSSLIPFSPDAILYHDDSRAPFRINELEKAQIPLFFYSIDSHIHYKWQPEMCGMFDCIFVAQKEFVQHYSKYVANVKWLPLWAPILPQSAPSNERETNVCFRGSLDSDTRSDRRNFLNELSSYIQIDMQTGPYIKAFTKAKIVINQSIRSDVNFRVFEAMACGALLVTPNVELGLKELFTDGVHLITYQPCNAKDARDKITYYLSHENERLKIAQSGFDLVEKSHSAAARAKTISDEINNIKLNLAKPFRWFSAMYQTAFEIVHWTPTTASEMVAAAKRLAELILTSAQSNEPNSEATISAVATTLTIFNTYQIQMQGFDLLRICIENWPEERIYQILTIGNLQNGGQAEEAKELALKIGYDPTIINREVDLLFKNLLEAGPLFFGRSITLPKAD